MKYLHLFRTKVILLSVLFLGIVSCSDSECNAVNWIGTYTFVEGGCADSTIFHNLQQTITAGSEDNTILWDGIEAEITGCELDFTSNVDAELDGDILIVTGLGCDLTYMRQ